ncbi:DUF1980 domain-containing protein [Bacillus sp. BGMRC 2118]|nr:DUF1980 domain-containing protein [Bacillus sp. BGMRC 2118]
MKKDMGFHQFIRGIILIGFSLFLVKMIVTGTVTSYSSTAMLPIIYLTTGALLLLGVLHVWRSGGTVKEQNVSMSRYRSIILYGVFVGTIVIGLLFANVTPNIGESREDYIQQLDRMFGIEEDLPSDLHLEE